MRDNVGKRVLSEFLSFLKYKVDNDLLTMEEVESIARVIEENLTLIGTAGDSARELADIICRLGCPNCGRHREESL